MPNYDYLCKKCDIVQEITHSIHKDPKIKCEECGLKMNRLISASAYVVAGGLKESLEGKREIEHTKKVKDPERAVRSRKRAFGSEAVGDPSMVTDPLHVVKRGRTLGGQQKEVDRGEFIKATAKDDVAVSAALKAIKKGEMK